MSFRFHQPHPHRTTEAEDEAGEITNAALKRHAYGDRTAAETCDVVAIADVVVAILQVLTPEQRAQILEKLK